MTDAQKLLALAERLGHKALLGRDAFANGERHDPDGVYLCLDDGLQLFDPANNSEQAIAVWCWLTCVCGASDETGMIGVLNSPRLYFLYSTPAEWRAAVRKAALRVVG